MGSGRSPERSTGKSSMLPRLDAFSRRWSALIKRTSSPPSSSSRLLLLLRFLAFFLLLLLPCRLALALRLPCFARLLLRTGLLRTGLRLGLLLVRLGGLLFRLRSGDGVDRERDRDGVELLPSFPFALSRSVGFTSKCRPSKKCEDCMQRTAASFLEKVKNPNPR